jgi:butyrate kinase
VNDGEAKARLCYDAFVYQVAKEIGSLTPVTNGKVDAILMTGGICHNKQFTDDVIARVGWIAPVFIYPGEEELPALNWGVLNVLRGKEKARIY